MNKRIGQLAEQAGLLGPTSRVGNSHEATERFAELLILECATIADLYADELLRTNPSGHIKHHFGIKE